MATKLFCKWSIFYLSHASITCRELVPLLSPCVTSAVVTLKWFNAWKIYARTTIISRGHRHCLRFFLSGEMGVAVTRANF